MNQKYIFSKKGCVIFPLLLHTSSIPIDSNKITLILQETSNSYKIYYTYILRGGGTGGSGGVGPPLEFEIYLVNFLKNRKKGVF